MESGNDNVLKTHPTAIIDDAHLSISDKKLDYSSSTSSDSSSEHLFDQGSAIDDPRSNCTANNGGISTVEENKIETTNFDEMKRLESSSSPATENMVENDLDTSSDEDDGHPLNYFEIKSPLSAMDDQNESLSVSNFGKKPETDVSEADFSPRGKMTRYTSSSSSSSSSSDSDSGSEDNSKSSNGNTDSTKLKAEDDIPTQYPPLQVMEREEDPAPSPYRIPSHIFGRTKSNTPVEWSVASNESLFSIHMGNSSFNRDQLCWLGKSGELCKPGEFIAPPQPSTKPTETRRKSADLDEEPVVTEATAAETMREVIRENAEKKQNQNPFLREPVSRSASLSQRSDGSTKSFAFPILTGVGEKSISLKDGGDKQKNQFSSPAPSLQPPSSTDKDLNPGAPTSKWTKNGFHLRYFSYLSCCPFCRQR